MAPSPAPAPMPRSRGTMLADGRAAELWAALSAAHELLLAASDDHLRLCASRMPDTASLTNARWRVAQASRVRMTLLIGTILPPLEARCGADDRDALHRFGEATIVYRRHISEYVKRWPIGAIVGDWAAYTRAADRLRADIVTRVELETALLKPMLERLDAGLSG